MLINPARQWLSLIASPPLLHSFSSLRYSFLSPVLTPTSHPCMGHDFNNHSIYKTLESDSPLGRRPDKPWLLGQTNQISLLLPSGAPLFSVRKSDGESAGAGIESI